MKKTIIVTDARQIFALGGLRGPVGPFTADTKTIFSMLSEGCNVVEVLKNGEHFELSYQNFDKDLNEELGINAELESKNKPVPVAFEEFKKQNNIVEKSTKAVKTSMVDVCEDV